MVCVALNAHRSRVYACMHLRSRKPITAAHAQASDRVPGARHRFLLHLGRARSPMPSRPQEGPFSTQRAPRSALVPSTGRPRRRRALRGRMVPTVVANRRSLASPSLSCAPHPLLLLPPSSPIGADILYRLALPHAAPARGTERTARHGAAAQTQEPGGERRKGHGRRKRRWGGRRRVGGTRTRCRGGVFFRSPRAPSCSAHRR